MPDLKTSADPTDQLVALLKRLCAGHDGPLGIAVSGGGDSLALLLCVADWAKSRGQPLLCLTLDHGIRPDAADEAAFVAARCAALGIAHQTLTWSPPDGKVTPVSQATARRARHGLLAGALRAAGGRFLLMGHTLDDQIETIAMRAARKDGQGMGAMAGMRALSVSPVWPEGRGVFLVRPFLDVSRAQLRAYLRKRGERWIDDPTNENRHYERVRMRQDLQVGETAKLQAALKEAGRLRSQQDLELFGWLKQNIETYEDGLISIRSVDTISQRALAEGLAWLLMAASGGDKRADRTGRLELAGDLKTAFGSFRARTLGGAWIAPRQGQVHIARDPGRAEAFPSDMPADAVWDGRFRFDVARNVHPAMDITQTEQKASPMARKTYPALEPPNRLEKTVTCLIPQRLKDIMFMLDHNNLMM